MVSRLRRASSRSAVLVAASLAACSAEPQPPSDLDMSLYALVETIDGTSLYPPLGPGAAPAGPFDSSLRDRLRVVLESTAVDGELRTEAIFDHRSSPPLSLLGPQQLYFVNAPAATYFTDPSRAYRFRVLLDGSREIARSDMTSHIFTVLRWVPNVQVGVKIRTEARPIATITSVTPSRVARNYGAVTLTIAGTHFARDSYAQFAGQDLATRRAEDGSLLIDVPEAVTGVPGTYPITVVTLAPGGGTSAAATFSVYDPPAVVSSVTPAGSLANGPSVMITVVGDLFTDASRVYFDSTALGTTYSSTRELTAILPYGAQYYAGNHTISVLNPPNVPSNGVIFTVSNPAPSLSSTSPTSVIAGGPAFGLTVRGSGFTRQSVIRFNGSSLSTSYSSSTELWAYVSPDWIASPATAQISVFSPAPGGGATDALPLDITSPVPTLSSISPSTALVGSSTLALTLDGYSFVSGATARWDGAALPTTFVSRNRLVARVPRTQFALGRSVFVSVDNPQPFVASSGAVRFTVLNPAPTITSINPQYSALGVQNIQLTVTGSSFMPDAQISFAGTGLPTTFVSASRLTAPIPLLASAGYPTVTVSNPAPAAGTASMTMTVNNPVPRIDALTPSSAPEGTTTGFWITLDGANFLSPYIHGPLHARAPVSLVSSTRLLIYLSPSQLAMAQDYEISVRNALPCPGYSGPVSFHVLPATCTDGIQNGTETGVDCGGETCPACYQGCPAGSTTCTELNVGLASRGSRASASDSASPELPGSINDGASALTSSGWGNGDLAGSRVMISFPRPYPIYGLGAFWGGSTPGFDAANLPSRFEVQYSTDPTALASDAAGSTKWTTLSQATNYLTTDLGTVTSTVITPATWGARQEIGFNRVEATAVRLVFDGRPATSGGSNHLGLLGELVVHGLALADGAACSSSASCASGICGANGVCGAANCQDGVKNGAETDVDCGGVCAPCGDTRLCNAAADCASGVCAAGACAAPSCWDAIKNGSETDVDCGSRCALRCDDYQHCAVGVDCTSHICTNGICQVPTGEITSLSPDHTVAGDPDVALTLVGSMFRPTTVASFGGQSLATTYVSPTELRAVVPSALVATVGAFDVRVSTPGAAAPSGILTFLVTPSCTGSTTNQVCGLACVDVMTDPANCGACGNTCGGTTSVCSDGACVALPSSSLRAWYRSDVGLVRDATNRVTRWSDQSGHGWDLVPNATGPEYVTDAAAPRIPAVRFDASLSTMLRTENRIALLNGAGEFTVFVAVKPGTSQQTYADIVDYDHRSCQNFVVQQDYTTLNEFSTCGPARTLDSSRFQILTESYNLVTASSATCLGAVDGETAGPSGTSCTFGWSEPATFTVGGNLNYGRYFNGQVVEILVYNRALSASERGLVEVYLERKLATACTSSGDCASHVCADGLCQAPACADGVRNGLETDLDCGGNCSARCDVARSCRVNADCTTGLCASGACRIPDAVLTAIAPTSAVIGSPDLALTLTGSSFWPGARVSFNGTELSSTWSSSTQLVSTVPASLLTAAGSRTVSVTNPGTTAVSSRTFTVNNPAPMIASFTPVRVLMGSTATALTVTGASFVPGAVVSLAGLALSTTYVSATSLVANMPASALTASGYPALVVTNPSPSLGPSASRSFTIDNPIPTLATLSPSSLPAESATTIVTVDGAGFVANAQASLGDAALATTVVSGARVLATIPAALLTTPGSFALTVTSPAPTQGTSPPLALAVADPTCTDGVSNGPETGTDCGGGCLGCASGLPCLVASDCLSGVCQSGACAPPTCGDGVVQATAGEQCDDGNTSGGDGCSQACFREQPVLTALTPASVAAASGPFTLTLDGVSFTRQAVVRFAGTALATTFVSSYRLTASVPGSLVAQAGTADVRVEDPSNGSSAIVTFTIDEALLADSQLEFSEVQGQNNWYYGYYPTSNLSAAGFRQLEYYANGAWRHPVFAPPYTSVTARDHHPNGTNESNPGQEYSVRRWVAEVTGPVHVRGNIAKNAAAGDGVVAQIIRGDGTVFFSWVIAYNNLTGVDYDVVVPVAAGQALDFVIGAYSNDGSDSTRFTVRITTGYDNTLLADAVSEFSGVQGQSGWLYGLYPASNLRPAGFRQLETYSGGTWRHPVYNPPWTSIYASGGHPNGTNSSGGLEYLVRRWTSTTTGTVRVRGNFAKANPSCGDGVTWQIIRGDGTVYYTGSVAYYDVYGQNFDVSVPVTTGQALDFVLEPGGADSCDGSRMAYAITTR